MRIKPVQIDTPKGDPFANDKLERKQYAKILTSLIENADDGFTMSIDAEWGNGKTTFVRMWQTYLQQEGYTTIYINAWENDFYTADPFAVLINEMFTQIPRTSFSDEQYQLLSSCVGGLAAIAKTIPILNVIGAFGDACKQVIDECKKDKNPLQACESYTKLIQEFRQKLQDFVHSISSDKKVVIFVDELDRCRPDFAIEMLERIKHLFCVDGLVFVLSIDKQQLEASVKGHYGSESINATEYLKRFIDIEYRLPQPGKEKFILEQMQQHETFQLLKKIDGGQAYDVLKVIVYNDDMNLRSIEQYFTRLHLALLAANNATDAGCLVLLLWLNMRHFDDYEIIKNKQVSIEILLRELCAIFDIPKFKPDSDELHNVLYAIAALLVYYAVKWEYGRNNILNSLSNETLKSLIPSISDTETNDFKEFIKKYTSRIDIDSTFAIIELTSPGVMYQM